MIRIPSRHGQVDNAVAVEVPNRQAPGIRAYRLRSLEGAVAIPQQDTYASTIAVAVAEVCHGQVGDAVAVEICGDHGHRTAAGRVCGSRDETCEGYQGEYCTTKDGDQAGSDQRPSTVP